MQQACTRWHCRFDACDKCRLDDEICNGGDGDTPGRYCRHYSDELREQLRCVLCGVSGSVNGIEQQCRT